MQFPHYSPLSLRLSDEPDPAWRVHSLALDRRDAGEDVIILSIGEPDARPPAYVLDAMDAAVRAGRTRYTEARGEPAILEAIARYSTALAGRPVETDRLNFFTGAQAALFGILMTIAGEGEELIVPEPVYAPYLTVIAATGARLVHVPLRPERDFHLDPADVAAAMTDRTAALVLTNPHNPTGVVLSRDELETLGGICRERGVWLVSDEVYTEFAYARPFTSALALDGAEDYVAATGSLSKSYAMTGFRHGWSVTPTELGARAGVLLEAMMFGCPPFVQDAGVAAFADGGAFPREQRAEYQARLDLVLDILDGTPGIVVRRPEGGMFVMIDVRPTGLTADEFALRLLDEERVSLLPTDTFGPSAVGHVRLALCADRATLAEAAERVRGFAVRAFPMRG